MFNVRVSAPADYVVGASGVLDPASGWYHVSHAKSFALFLMRGAKVARSRAGEVEVQCIFTPKGEACAKLLLATATDVVNFYHQKFGFYPFPGLTIIPGMDRPAGGYPVATGIVAIHGMERMGEKPELHWRWIAAHEVGHEYWYEYVMPGETLEWLLIGLGIYYDREYVRARGLGLESHRELLLRYIQGVRDGLNTTAARTPEQIEDVKFDFNNVVTHGKGFAIISALSSVLGPATFDRVADRCLKEFSGRCLDAGRFRIVAEAESGQDLGWFFDQWVASNRFLSYEAKLQSSEKAQSGLYVSEVKVTCLGSLMMPVPVAASFEDGTSQVQFSDRLLKEQSLEFTSEAPLKEVRVDPGEELALVVPPPMPASIELAGKIRGLPWTGAGSAALTLFNAARQVASQLPDGNSWFKLGLTLYDGKYYAESLEAFASATDTSQNDATQRFAALVWQGHLLDLLGRRDEALQFYKKALAVQGFDYMRHDQYGLKIDRAWVEERLIKPFERK